MATYDPIKGLESVFQLRLANGKLVPFQCEPYQSDFFKKGMLYNERRTRVVNKSRKLGFTMLWMMEALTLANKHDYTFYPFAAVTESQAIRSVGLLRQLIDDAQVDIEVESVNSTGAKFKNGSEIGIFSGSSPESVRGPQAHSGALDEFAFNLYQKEMLEAFDPMMSQGGQLTIISTPNGVNNKYWQNVEQAKNSNSFVYVEQSIWKNPDRFDITRPIPEQLQEGLEIVSWWIDADKLEQQRVRDPISFLQEYCCKPAESSYGLFPSDEVEACLEDGAYEYTKSQFKGEDGKLYKRPYFTGCDFALSTAASADYSVTVTGFVDNGTVYVTNIWRQKGMSTPEQVDALERKFKEFTPVTLLVEENSFGKSIFDYLRLKVPIVDSFRTGEQSKRTLVRQLQEFIKNGKLKIRKGVTKEEREISRQWVKEMCSFSRVENRMGTNYKLEGAGEHDDMVMATGIMLQAVVDWMGGISASGAVSYAPKDWGPVHVSNIVESRMGKKLQKPTRLARSVVW